MLHNINTWNKLLPSGRPVIPASGFQGLGWCGQGVFLGSAQICGRLCLQLPPSAEVPFIIMIDGEGEKGNAIVLASSSSHLSTNSELLCQQWGNYTVIITRSCAQEYTLAHSQSPTYQMGSPVSSAWWLSPSTFLLRSLQPSLSAPTRKCQPSWTAGREFVRVCVCEYELMFGLYAAECVRARPCTYSIRTAHLHMPVLTINNACLALGSAHHWQAQMWTLSRCHTNGVEVLWLWRARVSFMESVGLTIDTVH